MALDLLWSILSADPLLTGVFIIFFSGTFILAIILNIIGQYKLRKSGIMEVDKMSGRKFEEFLRVLLITRGYSVNLTPETGDYGADLILKTKGKKIIVQAKRYQKNVGIKAVQEISSARNHYNVDECWVITNSFFTKQAKTLAVSNNVKLIDRPRLMNWMLEEKKGA
ncbi:restriction endonuclease [Bacillus sp. IITD106]|nr:restriction endonuclease [Bacillus sp. IITD106]